MRVCLINPPWTVKGVNVWAYVRSTMPPLALLYLASTLEKEHIEVDVIDFQALDLNWEGVENKIKETKYDVYGLTATTLTVKNTYRVSQIIKKYFPNSMVVMGGVHVTALPDEPLTLNPTIDYSVRGDGEEALLNIVRGRPVDTIEGISYREGSKIVHVGGPGYVKDLNALPPAAYHKLDLTLYKPAKGGYKRLPAMNMQATRGCPGLCTFCNSANVTLRARNPEHIFAEMELLSKKFGIKEITFYDDTFTVYPQNIKKLCNLLIQNKTDLTWSCMARTDTVKYDMLVSMKKAGCHQVCYGIESADMGVLENIKKPIDLDRTREAVAITKKAGINVRCAFMFGNPGDTEETMERSVKFALELDPHIAMFNIAMPYPGTELFDWAKKNNCLLTEDWSDYDWAHPVMKIPTLSLEAVQAKYQEAYRRFYFRPLFLAKRLFKISSLEDLKVGIEGAKGMFRFLTPTYGAPTKPTH